jgi:glutamate synthase (NADPH/NADH) small chain
MRISGEDLNGVYGGIDFLRSIALKNPVKLGKRVAVIGGGNTAMDACRSAVRLGAKEVSVVYRRTLDEMPAEKIEIQEAMEEGVIFRFLRNPAQIIGENGKVKAVKLQVMELGEPDASGRRSPVAVEGSEFDLPVDSVIMALGTSPNPLIKATTEGLETQRWGGIIAEEETGKTSRGGIYAGGDAVTGAATVILAMGAGKNAAAAIDEYLKNK